MKIFVILLCSTLAIAEDVKNNANPVVNSPSGVFKGSILKSQSGKDILSFRGIRYAVAPTGTNRFKQAYLAKPHDGIYDATHDGPVCPLPYNHNEPTSEDCLRLNIYSNELPQNSSHQLSLNSPRKSVVVYLHTGAFWEPFGSSYGFGPQYALDHNIVLVTINYRVGSLGFLSTGDKHAPGNAGLKDQVLALRWVKQNIESFGGNPNSVTLAGHNIGSASVTLHIVSPLSKDLFHRAIIMSGASPTHNILPHDQKDLAKKQAELLGCPIDTSDNILNCLYEKSPEDFINSYRKLSEFNGHPVVWTPVIEPEYYEDSDEKPFLTRQPADLIREGKANFVPFCSVIMEDEFGYLAIRAEEQAQSGNNKLYDEFNNNWNEIAPKRFDYERDTSKSLETSRALRSFYFNNQSLKAGSYQQLGNLYSDSSVSFPVHRFQRLMTRYSPESVWNGLNNYDNCDTYRKWSNGKRFGTVHYDHLILLFKIPGRADLCERDSKRVKEIWEWIANFADTGNPTPETKADKNSFKWLPSTKDHPQYFEYKGEEQRMVSGVIHQERMNKWDELFPID